MVSFRKELWFCARLNLYLTSWYGNEFESKENKIKTKDKIELQYLNAATPS